MAKLQMGEQMFERQYAEATRRGRKKLKMEPRVKAVHYDRASQRIVVDLFNGCSFVFPPSLVQDLSSAPPEDLSQIRILGPGTALDWPRLDVQFSVAGLLGGFFGSKSWMSELGRQGGRVTSEVKRATSRANGTKGGRPRKKAA